MKILHTVEFYDPSIGGMQEVVKQISEELVKFGNEVTIATTKIENRKFKILNGVKIVEFNIRGNYVNGIYGEVKKYEDFLINSDFDIVTNFAAQQWATDIALINLSKIKSKKVLVPTGFSGLFIKEYNVYFKDMINYMKKYDRIIFLSYHYRDINFAKNNKINNYVIIPNGASEKEFLNNKNIDLRKKINISKNNFLILLVGSHTGAKGHKEAIEIFIKTNIKNSTLLIVSDNNRSSCEIKCKISSSLFNIINMHKRIIVMPLSRSETISAFNQCDLFLFPSNIECSPIVLFECMASKTPFLVTDVGNSQEILEWSNGGGIILPTLKNNIGNSMAIINPSVKILEDLYKDPNKRKTMGENSFNIWKNKFTWEIIAKKYNNLYKDLIFNKSLPSHQELNL